MAPAQLCIGGNFEIKDKQLLSVWKSKVLQGARGRKWERRRPGWHGGQ
jgi:hypothetical protein